MNKEKLVFDTSLYSKISPNRARKIISEDLSGLALEAGKRPLPERINPRKLIIKDGQVVDQKSGKSVQEHFQYNTPLDKIESEVAKKFYDYLVKFGGVVIQISPPGGISPYKEGRLNLGRRINDEIEFYGIPTKLDSHNLLKYGRTLSSLFRLPFLPQTPDDLRSVIIPLDVSEKDNIWDYLQINAPLDYPAWDIIKKGNPWNIKKKALLDAKKITQKMIKKIFFAKNEQDFILAGAQAEKEMISLGWDFDASACVGLFNSDLFSQNTLSWGGYDSFGEWRPYFFYPGLCRSCNHYVEVGPCRICRNCENKFKKRFI